MRLVVRAMPAWCATGPFCVAAGTILVRPVARPLASYRRLAALPPAGLDTLPKGRAAGMNAERPGNGLPGLADLGAFGSRIKD